MAEEKSWFAPGDVDSLLGSVCKPRPREAIWTLTKGARRVDAELLYQSEHGVEVHFLEEGVVAYARRWLMRAEAVQEANEHRARLLRQGWTMPASTAQEASGRDHCRQLTASQE